ncbi:protein-tyrosine phosphatase [Anoxybacillus tengchongensis]|uniref:Tyrosine-protein phosphatase n=1 Tax=Anoxybacillus tengchongensis TaxID=576944 RepID=A0A7X0D9T9_9BACL|nr:protein-tyrosine phosphatase [Anoxybacillus tengchongensis]
MIDIHSHILPSIDDGAQTLADAIDMAKAAVAGGITTIIATPHHRNGTFENDKRSIIEHVHALNETLQHHRIPLSVLPGQEVRIHGELLDYYRDGDILPLAETKYVLIELPNNHVPRYTEQLIFDMQLQGLIPIIAHPERNSELVEHPNKLYDLVKKGVLTQLTAASVAGKFGKNIKKFSLQMIEANLVHLIASDAHNTTTRAFHMREAYDVIQKQFGSQVVYVFQENAELLVAGETLYKDAPGRMKKKKFFGIF